MKKYKKAEVKLITVYEFILLNPAVIESGAMKGLTKLLAKDTPHFGIDTETIEVLCHNLAVGAQKDFNVFYNYVSTRKRRLTVKEIIDLLKDGMAEGCLATLKNVRSDVPEERMKEMEDVKRFVQFFLDDVVFRVLELKALFLCPNGGVTDCNGRLLI